MLTGPKGEKRPADVVGNAVRVMTDEAGRYRHLDKSFAEHGFTRHGKGEHVVGDIHTNTIEGYFSVFKRGMKGACQHCAKRHLHRYLAEFDFRYNHRAAKGVNDWARTDELLRGFVGKRLACLDSLA